MIRAIRVFTLLCVLLVLCFCAQRVYACDAFVTVGKTTPSADLQPVGVAGVGCRFEKYDVQLLYVAEAKGEGIVHGPYVLATVARYWQLERRVFGGKIELHAGLGFKESETCDFNHDLNCNRRQPLPFSFHFGVGASWKYARLQLFHDSNNAMDDGPEAKNLGITWLTLTRPFN